MTRPDDDDATGWACACGAFVAGVLHCPRCGGEPPWGCPCGSCQDPEATEDDWIDTFEEFESERSDP